jgi:hypothetical protein
LNFNSIPLNFFIYKDRVIEGVGSYGIRRESFLVLGWCLKNL